ncbi:MAG: ComEC/Rec2 family competence protein, partial [Phycisphaerae bacterium]
QAGDRVRMRGWLYRPRGPMNPGAYDWAGHLRRRGIRVGLSCDHAEAVTVLRRGDAKGWRGVLASVRNRLRGYLIDPAFSADDPAAGVVAAMVLGRRSAVSKPMNEAFLRTGNVHFLAASGMHVLWLGLIGWGVTRVLGIHPRPAAVFVGTLILTFVLLAEPRPSILRAGIAGVLICAGAFFRGRYDSVNALACAAIVLLMIDPADLFTAAFQFSFLATLGLVRFCPLVSNGIARRLLDRQRGRLARLFIVRADRFAQAGGSLALPPVRTGLTDRVASVVALLFVVSVSEWFITAPLGCYRFNNFLPWGWFGTFTLGPLAMLTTSVGFLTVLLGLILPQSGVVLGPLLRGAAHLMVGWVDLLTHLPAGKLDGRSPSLVWVLSVYGVFWLWGYRRHWMPWRHGYKVAAGVLLSWWLIAPAAAGRDRDTLDVWMLAVGNGTGTVIELPNGRTMLYDFGTRSPFDAAKVGAAFLEHRRIRSIDTVFVSHPNFDHYGALESLSKRFPIRRLVISDQFEPFARDDRTVRRFLESMRARGVGVEIVHGSKRLDGTGEVVVETLWPPPRRERAAPDANESSMVLRLTYRGRRVLLTGDIAEWGIVGLLADGDLEADVLALPHHGGVVHNTAALLDAVDPRVVVRSTGQRDSLTTNNIRALVGDREYFNTADVGCVRITLRPDAVTASGFRTGD